MAAAPSPSSPRLPRGPALGARPLLPGPGSGVRSSLQATQFRTSRSKHWAWTHRVGAGASLPLGLLGPRLMLLRPLHPRLGLSRLLCPTGRKPGGATAHCPRPRPPARWGGTLPRGPRALCLRPSLSTCGFSLQPSLPPPPRPEPTPGRALGTGTVLGVSPGPALGQQRMGPAVSTQTSGCPPLSFSPRPAHSSRRSPLAIPLPRHLPPSLGSPLALLRKSWFSSSNTS